MVDFIPKQLHAAYSVQLRNLAYAQIQRLWAKKESCLDTLPTLFHTTEGLVYSIRKAGTVNTILTLEKQIHVL